MIANSWNAFCVGHMFNMDTRMGSLKPGATMIYEHVGGITYAREFGQTQRRVVGLDLDSASHSDQALEIAEWVDILAAAKASPALQDAVDRVKVLYNLSKPHE